MGVWTKFSLKNAGVILIAMIMLIAGGVYSVQTMKMEEMPNVDIPYVIVQVPYPGSTPEQGLEDIGKPMESTLSGVQKLKNLYVESHSNYVMAILEFQMNRKMEEAEKDVISALASLKLPEGAEKPVVMKDGPSQMSVLSFALSSESAGAADLTAYVNEKVKPLLATVEGIGKVEVLGDTEKQVSIGLNAESMLAKGISMEQVKQAIVTSNLAIPAGQVQIKDRTLNVQADFRLDSLEAIKQIEVGAGRVKLADIATVELKDTKKLTQTRVNGTPAILVEVKAQPGSNAVELVRQAKEKLDGLPLPAGYKLTIQQDSAVQVKKSVDSMLREVLLGTLFAVIVTFVFLRNIRATIVAVLSIPLSVLAAMITLKFLDYSLNMMTLAGIAVAVGRVIDDSIVVIENIYRRTLTSKRRNEFMVLEATKEVASAVTSSTVTTMAVFGPLSFVPGIIGRFFAPFGITVLVALAFSLLVSITVVPLLAKYFLLQVKQKPHKETGLQRTYKRVLQWTLRRRAITLLLSFVMFAGSLALVTVIPQNFLPEEKAVVFQLAADLPAGTSLAKGNEIARKFEAIVEEEPHVKSYETVAQGERVRLTILLEQTVSKEDSKAFEKEVQRKAKEAAPELQPALSPVSLTGGGQMMLVVEGGKAEDLKKAGEMIVDAIGDIEGLSNVKSNLSATKPQLSLEVNKEQAAGYGLNTAMIAGFVRSLINGDTVTNVQIDGKTTTLQLGMKQGDLSSVDAILNHTIVTPAGKQIKLSEVAALTEKPGPSALFRLNQQEYVEITGRYTTDNVSGVQAEVDKRMKTLELPGGVKQRSEGAATSMNEGFRNMAIAMGVAIMLVFIVMLVTFGSMTAPLAILTSLPFLFSGGLFGLYATKQALGMPALVGFLMLIGIVVTNAIVLMDRAAQNEKAGMGTAEALLEAGATRLRPILMTALATIGALVPLALSAEGGLISRSLAIVVISGLLTSTLLTLIIVPTAYHAMKGMGQRLRRKPAAVVAEEPA
ncbi:efflux RND transporter permease subunit [Ectobacillus ponti]|uniref:Efflux RND transporter permease subunit n=1 Tax=Ectobacillus ponti TaxID=2961894 RepID=A0AA41X865_9BACI|nr:efflux RND transporter permease subunit [Ectobacillus ponti]MCP8968660.1 efflux RND transporter permease subunit [Ectobacillus ponti]